MLTGRYIDRHIEAAPIVYIDCEREFSGRAVISELKAGAGFSGRSIIFGVVIGTKKL